MNNRIRARVWLAVMTIVGAACSRPEATDSAAATQKNSAVAAPIPVAEKGTILLLGTSITAGYGLDPAQAWSSLVQLKIDSAGLPFRVVNAGVSGETSAGARRRTDWLFGQGPVAVLMVETGANDGLRGQSVDSLRANLDAILTQASALTPRPVLIVAGMEALPNLGRRYGDQFRAVFPEMAARHDAHFLPFLLDGVAGVESLNQADGIHPNAAGSRRVARNVWRALEPILRTLAGS